MAASCGDRHQRHHCRDQIEDRDPRLGPRRLRRAPQDAYDLIDWSFGYGRFGPEHQPEHRSIRRLVATHFKPDGAYWEMCSGYHLYPLQTFCELAVLSKNLTVMDSRRFPPGLYDLTDKHSEGGRVIHRALEWFMSMAMPDRTMPTVGDSMAPRAGMEG